MDFVDWNFLFQFPSYPVHEGKKRTPPIKNGKRKGTSKRYALVTFQLLNSFNFFLILGGNFVTGLPQQRNCLGRFGGSNSSSPKLKCTF